jgi:hypothetical protein
MKSRYTKEDVEQVFSEFRDVLNANQGRDAEPDHEDYTFRLDAMIRCWIWEMQESGINDTDLFEALRHALAWAGWHAVLEVSSGTIH